jgi:serine/threonine protein kinase
MATDPYHINLSEFDIQPEVLGNGAYSEIIVAIHRRDNQRYALKIVDKEKAQRHNTVKYFLNERRVMLLFNHDRIIKLKWTTKDMQNIYFIYEIAPHGELWETLRGFPSFQPPPLLRRYWISQLIASVEYFHMNHTVAHRDIKPENILLDENFNLKLCDFGTSKVMTKAVLDGEYHQYLKAVAEATQRVDQVEAMRKMSGLGPTIQGNDVLSADENRRRSILYQASRTQSFTGTPHYMAPEVIQTKMTRGLASDLWAIGVVIFQLETGELPFQHESPYAVMNEVVEMRCDLNLVEDRDARDLIRQLFKKNPKERIGVVGDDGCYGTNVGMGVGRGKNDGQSGQHGQHGQHGQNDEENEKNQNNDDYSIPADDIDNYTNDIDPLTKRPKPKLLSDTTVSTTQLGWDAIKAHPYFTRNKNQENDEKNDENDKINLKDFIFNGNLPDELIQIASEARKVCYNFITYSDESGNPVLHPKQVLQDEIKKKEEDERRRLDKELEEAFPHIDGNIEDPEGIQIDVYSSDDDDDDDDDNGDGLIIHDDVHDDEQGGYSDDDAVNDIINNNNNNQ